MNGTRYAFPIVSFDNLSSLVLPAGFGQPTAGMDLTSLFDISLAATNGTGGWSGGNAPQLQDISVLVGTNGRSIDITVVPEPGAFVIGGIGAVCAVGLMRWRRRRSMRTDRRGR